MEVMFGKDVIRYGARKSYTNVLNNSLYIHG